jgi:hypothetical protein
MNDYHLQFRFHNGNTNAEQTIDQLIDIVERVHSALGGGCDPRGGEFFIETGTQFQLCDLLDMIGVLLPESKTLTIKAVAKEKPAVRRVSRPGIATRKRRPTRRKG